AISTVGHSVGTRSRKTADNFFIIAYEAREAFMYFFCRSKMFFTRKRSKRWTSMEMCKFRMDTRQQLQDTYWDHAGNQTVCQGAMDQLPNLHVSKKADEAWILAYVESIREVYSHASANLPELLFTDAQREEERKRYWLELSKMFSKVLYRITQLPDAHHPFSPVGRMACMMSYASLYSVYKTVAIECNNLSTVHSAAKKLNEMEQGEYSTVSDMEKNQLKMLYENIDLINILSLELPKKYDLMPPPRRRSSAEETKIKVETPLSAHLRDFPKTFIDELKTAVAEKPKVELVRMEAPAEKELPPLPPIITIEEPSAESASSMSSLSPRESLSVRPTTIEDYAEEIADEIVTTTLQEIGEKNKKSVEQITVFEPIVQQISELKTDLYASPRRSVEEEEEETPKVEEKEEKEEELLELSPFDPASCFKEADKIERYGRRGLFDSPLPVIGRKLPIVPLIARQHSSPSESKEWKDQGRSVLSNPSPALLSPTFNQKLENKIIQAVLNEKPVSPMFPPPAFALDDFIVNGQRY
ncbi:hypothetical protein PRIPAC_92404, partial [Pristionchus pacificus]|uniref:Uncharacterized protein n=1 Tax=Pristionchus pacificus TaxID=54126 RepID=A0A2A6CDY2_PRIPA